MNKMKAIIAVNTKKGFKLELKFNTGEIKLFDATPYLEKGVFKTLKDEALFKQAFVALMQYVGRII